MTTIYIYTDTNPITLPCSLARAGNNEGTVVESWEVIKLLQAETMKDLVESWNVILLMKLLQALIIWNPGRSFR